MATYSIIPNDTLFFRGGEPMGMGETHFQTSVFPPSPDTFIGAVRSTIITQQCDGDFEGYTSGRYADSSWCREIGIKDRPDTFRFAGPFLKKEANIFLPPPSNLFTTPDRRNFAVASPSNFPEVLHSSAIPQIMWQRLGKDWKPAEGWISVKGMAKYLSGSVNEVKEDDFIFISESPTGKESVLKNEARVGIAIAGQGLRTVTRGYLYSTVHRRFVEGCSMVFILHGVPSFPDNTLVRLGGENRTAWCERVEELVLPSAKETADFLVTTMPVKAGKSVSGIPVTEFLDKDSSVILPGGVRSKLLAYSVGKPILFGGWDMAENRPKEMIQYIPAGSVFCFERCDVKGQSDKYLLGGSDVH